MSQIDDNFTQNQKTNLIKEKKLSIIFSLLSSCLSVGNATMLKFIVSKLEVNFADTLFFRFIWLFIFTALWTKYYKMDVF